MHRTYEWHKKKPKWDKVLTNSLSQFPADLFMAKVFVFLTECGKLYVCTVACKGEGMSGRETGEGWGTMARFLLSYVWDESGKGKSHCGPDVIRLFSSVCSCKIKKLFANFSPPCLQEGGCERKLLCFSTLRLELSCYTSVNLYCQSNMAKERRNVEQDGCMSVVNSRFKNVMLHILSLFRSVSHTFLVPRTRRIVFPLFKF